MIILKNEQIEHERYNDKMTSRRSGDLETFLINKTFIFAIKFFLLLLLCWTFDFNLHLDGSARISQESSTFISD